MVENKFNKVTKVSIILALISLAIWLVASLTMKSTAFNVLYIPFEITFPLTMIPTTLLIVIPFFYSDKRQTNYHTIAASIIYWVVLLVGLCVPEWYNAADQGLNSVDLLKAVVANISILELFVYIITFGFVLNTSRMVRALW